MTFLLSNSGQTQDHSSDSARSPDEEGLRAGRNRGRVIDITTHRLEATTVRVAMLGSVLGGAASSAQSKPAAVDESQTFERSSFGVERSATRLGLAAKVVLMPEPPLQTGRIVPLQNRSVRSGRNDGTSSAVTRLRPEALWHFVSIPRCGTLGKSDSVPDWDLIVQETPLPSAVCL